MVVGVGILFLIAVLCVFYPPDKLGPGMVALVLVLAFVVTGALLFYLQGTVVRPLRALGALVDDVRRGKLDSRAPVGSSNDEVNALARSLNGALDHLVGLTRGDGDRKRLEGGVVQLLEIVSAAAEGDLTARGELTHDELASVTDALNHMLESIGRLVLEVRRSGSEVTSSAERILTLSEAMASGAAKQSIVLNQVTRKIGALGQRSLEINQIVELIDEISAQTNMLALNAAIEASKAGEQGKGFAVVANEVRKLAERTSSATKDIGAFIQSIQEATEEAIRAMEEVRGETRSTADGALDTARAADKLVDAARQLGMTIGRFKVHRRDAGELARTLEVRRHELRTNVKALLDLADVAVGASPTSRVAAEQLLDDLEKLTRSARQRIVGGATAAAEGEGTAA
jgi:methyl-accepting chemotaxis protein